MFRLKQNHCSSYLQSVGDRDTQATGYLKYYSRLDLEFDSQVVLGVANVHVDAVLL